ncbi:MAG TPA: hypothetical protein VF748_11055 [Candidatus Acidoferrum sp.]
MTATVHKLRPVKFECSACGMPAGCDCGAKLVPAGTRAAAAVAANPEKSDRAIAADIGVSQPTVSRARKKTTDTSVSVERRTGRDGRTRRQPSLRRRIAGDAAEAIDRRVRFVNYANSCIRNAQNGAGLIYAMPEELTDEIMGKVDEVIGAWQELKADLLKRKRS